MADITIPRQELEELSIYRQVNNHGRAIAYAQVEKLVEGYYGKGYGDASHQERWPDWLLQKVTRCCLITAASPSIPAQPGEIDVSAELVEAGESRPKPADIGLTGAGSLLGQVALELMGRLEAAMWEDERARIAAPWLPPEAPP